MGETITHLDHLMLAAMCVDLTVMTACIALPVYSNAVAEREVS